MNLRECNYSSTCSRYRFINSLLLCFLLQALAFAKLKRSASTYSFDGKMDPEPLYEEDAKKIEDRENYISAHPEESEDPIEPEEPTEVTVEVPTNPSCWKKIQKKVAHLVNTSAFETLITLCILFNTLAMALEHFEMDKMFSKVLEYCNLVKYFHFYYGNARETFIFQISRHSSRAVIC